jgi:hypothetical protein
MNLAHHSLILVACVLIILTLLGGAMGSPLFAGSAGVLAILCVIGSSVVR